MNSQFPFQLQFQLAICKMMLKDDDFLQHCVLYLKDEYFENLYLGWLFSKIVSLFKQFEKRPSVDTLRNEISKFANSERLPYDTILEKVLSCEFDDEAYLREELTRFVKGAVFLPGAKTILSYHNNGEHDKAWDAVQELSESIRIVDFSGDDTINFDNFDKIMESIRSEAGNKVRTGIETFDQELNGGIPIGSILVFLGVTNVGKSAIMVNAAVNIMKQGKKVVFVDLEMTEDITLIRFIGRLTGINLNRLSRNEKFLEEEERQKIRKAREFLKEHLKLKIFKSKSGEMWTVEDLALWCKQLKNKWDYDAIICDYAQKLGCRDRFSSAYERYGAIYYRLELIAKANNCVAITAAQCNREARRRTRYSKDVHSLIRVEDVADSQWIINNAGYVITITKSEKDEANNRIKFLLDKQRIGRTNIAIQYNTCFDSCTVFGPDVPCEPISTQDEEEEEKEE